MMTTTPDELAPDRPGSDFDQIVNSLMPGQSDALWSLFTSHGARTPWIVWSPAGFELRSPVMRRFADICRSLADETGVVRQRAFALDAFDELADWMMVVAPTATPHSFVYRHYGKHVAEHYGRDMTGQTTDGFGGYISQFFGALYSAAMRRGEWVLSEHEPPKQVFVRNWRRLIVPLVDDAGAVAEFAVLNVPDSEFRAGLELIVDPVFVLDAGQHVYFANKAAKVFFGITDQLGAAPTLHHLTGIDLDGLDPPEDMLRKKGVQDSIQLVIRNSIIERVIVTANAIEHRGGAFYVVVIRLIGS